MDVSIVIPTFNRQRSLVRCLSRLPADVEVIVVDDGSCDGTSEAVSKIDHPKLTYLRQEHSGPAAARNYGLSVATSRYVAFTDDDCIPTPSWPWPLIRRLDQEGTDVAGVGGRVLPLRYDIVSRYYTYHRILEPPNSCSYPVTANCAYRRELVQIAGGFDNSIRHAGGEDPALSFAVRSRGHQLIFDPSAVVIHDFREGLFDFIKTFYRYGKGCYRASSGKDAQTLGSDELAPRPLSIGSVWGEIERSWQTYRRDHLPKAERLRFSFLSLLQRAAYNAGWSRQRAQYANSFRED